MENKLKKRISITAIALGLVFVGLVFFPAVIILTGSRGWLAPPLPPGTLSDLLQVVQPTSIFNFIIALFTLRFNFWAMVVGTLGIMVLGHAVAVFVLGVIALFKENVGAKYVRAIKHQAIVTAILFLLAVIGASIFAVGYNNRFEAWNLLPSLVVLALGLAGLIVSVVVLRTPKPVVQ